eukprot:TRINITY_DN75169_c0_g1_i1.p1 TRINITY_DN75169_c0_g1~~TRINITY_DN75169_c0_g1_i1.p1  ORF type:complete len:1128 (+),score=208.64 TRINITY_DN75169_c0_g1_i1:25-3384(+)
MAVGSGAARGAGRGVALRLGRGCHGCGGTLSSQAAIPTVASGVGVSPVMPLAAQGWLGGPASAAVGAAAAGSPALPPRGARWVSMPSAADIAGTSKETHLGFGVPHIAAGSGANADGSNRQLWDLLEYNAQYFNAHRMAPMLQQVLEEPLAEARSDPRLKAYLQKAATSAKLYENLKDLTAKDIALAVASAREVGLVAAEDLSDVLVATVSDQLPRVSAQRVSFFITAFAKQRIDDPRFWRASALSVMKSTETLSPQVVVSLLDAFRKSGLRSERLFTSLTHRVYGVIDDLGPAHIPPIVATICRVSMQQQDKERALQALLGRWLAMLKRENEKKTGAITMQQILSLTVSIGLKTDELNTATFALQVSSYIGDRMDMCEAEDLIVFLWALQRLVPTGILTEFFVKGLLHVRKTWQQLQASAQLSAQRLLQLSDVLVAVRQDNVDSKSSRGLQELQEYVIADMVESVQYCQPDGLGELLEIWAGGEKFWRHYRDFGEAITKRMEEILLESNDLDEVVPMLRAVLAVPGLLVSLPGRARQVLATAVRSRGAADVERIRSIVIGTPWEAICDGTSGSKGGSRDGASTAASVPSSSSSSPTASAERHAPTADADTARGVGADEQVSGEAVVAEDRRGKQTMEAFLAGQGLPHTDAELAALLRGARDCAIGAEDALQALQAVAPCAQRLAADASEEILSYLSELCDELARDIASLDAASVVAALHSCAVAGVPHAHLAASAALRLHTGIGEGAPATPLQIVEVVEACAALRLRIPELRPWLTSLLTDGGLERRLPVTLLARLLAGVARLGLSDADGVELLLPRLLIVASSIRPPPLDTLAMLCRGLYLSRWVPTGPELFQIAAWLSQQTAMERTPAQAASLQYFALGILARPEGQEAAECLGPELRRTLAEQMMQQRTALVRQDARSDTSLKFRHDVTEVLRRTDQSYDLDLRLGPGLHVDLALLGSDIGRGARRHGGRNVAANSADGQRVLWLLDGPEAFHRPFYGATSDGSGGGEPMLQLMPAELRRAELLAAARCPSESARMTELWSSWAGGGSAGVGDEQLELGSALLNQRGLAGAALGPLARLHWLEWSAMTPEARLAALADPTSRPAVAPAPPAAAAA